jgi:hypothetical protein
MTFRTPAAETEGALSRKRFALMSTYAILAQLMEDMLHPPTHRNPTGNKGGTQGRHYGQMKTGRGSITQFI